MVDHYLALEVSRDASQAEVADAYRKLVGRYHPDRHADNDLIELAEEKLKAINEAYAILSDPDRRSAYDRELNAAGPVIRMSAAEVSRPPWLLRVFVGMIAGALLVFLFRLLQHPRAAVFFLLTFGLVWFYNRRRQR